MTQLPDLFSKPPPVRDRYVASFDYFTLTYKDPIWWRNLLSVEKRQTHTLCTTLDTNNQAAKYTIVTQGWICVILFRENPGTQT